MSKKSRCYGVSARNPEQQQAISYLTNPEIDLVILEGIAGSGKSLLSVAAALEQVVETKMYKELMFTRAPVPVGDDLGFLPGDLNDKLVPWMGAFYDNLEVLLGDTKSAMSFIENKVKIASMSHMRGRSLNQRYVIIDEVQNITTQQIKVLLTRAGEDTKIVCLGDVSQIDTRGLTSENNALSYLVSKAESVDFIKYVKLIGCERSRLASWAVESL